MSAPMIMLMMPACVAVLALMTFMGSGVWVWLHAAGLVGRFSISLAAALGLLILSVATFYGWGPNTFAWLVSNLTGLSLVSILLWFRITQRDLTRSEALASLRQTARDLAPYAVIFVAAYTFFATILTYDLRSSDLPIATTMNSDVFVYVKMANILQSMGTGNLADFDSYYFIRHDVIGSIAILALTSLLSGLPAIDLNLALLASFAALTIVAIAHIIRLGFRLPYAIGGLLAIQAFATPLFMHILFSYFLSQTMHATLLMAAFGSVLFQPSNGHFLKDAFARAVPPMVFGGAILFTYGTFYYSDIALLLVACGAAALASTTITVGAVLRAAAIAVLAITIAVAGDYLVSPARFISVYYNAIYHFTANVGYPLPLVSLLALAGLPVGFGDLRASVDQIGACCIEAILVALAFAMLRRNRRSLPQLFLIATFFGLQVIYIVVWLKLGISYQQWKFASAYPLLAGFVLLSMCVAASLDSTRNSRFVARGLTAALTILLAVNVWVGSKVWHGKVLKFPNDYRSLSTIDDMDDVSRVALNFQDIYADLIAPMFINRKPIEIVAKTPFSKDRNRVIASDAWFLTRRLSDCVPDSARNIGSGFTLSPTDSKSYLPRQDISFAGDASKCLTLSGFSSPEPSALWTDSHNATITLTCDCRGERPKTMVMTAQPYNGRQRITVRVNGVAAPEMLIDSQTQTDIQIPLTDVQDFTKPIKLEFDLPDAESPKARGGADVRLLGMAVSKLRLK